MTFPPLFAIIIEINIVKHRNDTKIDIRKITPSNLPILTQLFDYNDPAEMIEQNKLDMNNGTIDIFVMFDNDRPIGELHVAYESDDERAVKGKRAYLFAFRIHEDYQGHGLGKQLLKALLIFSPNRVIPNLLSVWRTIMTGQGIYMTASDLPSLSPESLRSTRAMGMSMDCI